MATLIKVATPSSDIPRFIEGGLTITNGWSSIDLDTLNDEQRDTLSKYTGRFIRVHDEDLDTFRTYLGTFGAAYDPVDGTVKDPQREEREKAAQAQRDQSTRDAEALRTARGTNPGQPPAEPEPGTFQAAHGPGGRVVDESVRERSDTAPDKPSTLSRDKGKPSTR